MGEGEGEGLGEGGGVEVVTWVARGGEGGHFVGGGGGSGGGGLFRSGGVFVVVLIVLAVLVTVKDALDLRGYGVRHLEMGSDGKCLRRALCGNTLVRSARLDSTLRRGCMQ